MIESVSSRILNIGAINILLPINHIKIMTIRIKKNSIFRRKIGFYGKFNLCTIDISLNIFYIGRFFFKHFNPNIFRKTFRDVSFRIIQTNVNVNSVISDI